MEQGQTNDRKLGNRGIRAIFWQYIYTQGEQAIKGRQDTEGKENGTGTSQDKKLGYSETGNEG